MFKNRIPTTKEGSAQSALNAIKKIEKAEARLLAHLLDRKTGELVYAGFMRRLTALTIDLLIIGLVFALLLALLASVGVNEIWIAQFFAFYITLLIPAYFVCATSVWRCTLGKFAVNARVVSDKDNRLSLGQTVLRELSKAILLPLMMVSGIMLFFSKKRKTLHDSIASSAVVTVIKE